MESLIAKILQNSYLYQEYRNHVTKLLLEGLSSGHTQSEDLTHYSTLNEVRMNRLDKTITVSQENADALNSLEHNFTLLVISEGWCGDAAQILPVMHKMAEASSKLSLRIVLRDDNDELMSHFLTNGGKSIPKLIVVNPVTNAILGSWGPRPAGAVQLINDFKEKYGVINEEAKTELQKWYLHDKGLSTINEICEILQKAYNK